MAKCDPQMLEKRKRMNYTLVRSTPDARGQRVSDIICLGQPLSEKIQLNVKNAASCMGEPYSSFEQVEDKQACSITMPLPSAEKPARVIIGNTNVSVTRKIWDETFKTIFCSAPDEIKARIETVLKVYKKAYDETAASSGGYFTEEPKLTRALVGLGMQAPEDNIPSFDLMVLFPRQRISRLASTLIFQRDEKDGIRCSVTNFGVNDIFIAQGTTGLFIDFASEGFIKPIIQ